MTHRYSLIDQLLDDARSRGLYQPDVYGAGALAFDDVTHVDPADRVGYHLLKSNGFAPPVLEERTALLQEHAELRATLQVLRGRIAGLPPDKQTLLLQQTQDKLVDLWRRTLDFNLVSPLVLQIEGIRVEYELQLLRAAINAPAAS